MLNSNVLVLNRSFLPIHVTSVRRAFSLVYQDVARVVNEEYRTFDFESWQQLAVARDAEAIGTARGRIRVPRVILLVSYDRVPRRRVRFSRFNVFARDNNTCQYCGKRFARHELNIDHVIPRSQNGLSTWENVVCSCFHCNRVKGGRRPEEAGVKLITKPVQPEWTPFMLETFSFKRYREWLPFLNEVDAAYWNTELLER